MSPLAAFARLKRLARPNTDAIAARAEELGYERLSKSDKSTVYAMTDSTVLKAAINDDPYRSFATYAGTQSDDPHLPQIREAVHFDNGLSLYLIERLSQACHAWSFDPFIRVKDLKNFAPPGDHAAAAQFRRDHPSLSETIDRLYRAKRDWHISDLSPDNVLYRGTIPVVSDPWA